MDKKFLLLISKVEKYVNRINNYVKGIEKQDFMENTMLIEACVFGLIQIRELAGHIDDEYKKIYSDIPWHKMRGIRHRLVHDYEGVILEMVWLTIKNDLPTLHKQLEKIRHS